MVEAGPVSFVFLSFSIQIKSHFKLLKKIVLSFILLGQGEKEKTDSWLILCWILVENGKKENTSTRGCRIRNVNDIGEVNKKVGINFIQKFFPLYLTRRFFQKR
jgi:hypothetical protein